MVESVTENRKGPLADLRVLDLGLSWAGPYAGMVLADLGADVIKVESAKKLEILRWSGAFAEGVRNPERSGFYTACNWGKRSITLNFKEERARELLLELVETSDVLIENFAPRVLPGLGLGYEQLRQRNENLIMVSVSGYGATGPQRDHVSYGDHVLQASGFAQQTGLEQDPPTMIGTYYGDPVGGMYAALGILAAVAERDGGAGARWLDLSQVEGLVSLLPTELLRGNAGVPAPRSAARSETFAPQGFFRCTGPDSWVAIMARDDTEWAELRGLVRAGGITVADHDSIVEGRAHADEIDAAVGQWTNDKSPSEGTRASQDAGVPAHPVLDAPGMLRDMQLADRGFFSWVDRPVSGPGPIPGVTLRIAGDGSRVRGYAPLLGDHNEEIFTGLLGLPNDEFGRLVKEGVIA